ncbi:cell division protein FtsH [Helicobacter enhydrae]|uniref:ATP-dependent zinc metalloprotease FtsH n=1 Tax=Helicobacter enhydrae TaxID=222136 RepID=A0A1B1U5R2_9HELI|nr:ATP-dependent zinc metalloprotease FtsH [Helicobacter enhydrae]ANV98096.1 cell division protein FtsH [Helicobacter enhydrae]
MNQKQPNDKKPLSKNPIIVVAILTLVAMIVFRYLSPSNGALTDKVGQITTTKDVDYSELKQMIKNKEVDAVSIGQTLIKAASSQTKTLYVAKKVADSSLVGLLDENHIPYSGFSEENIFSDVLSWVMPFLLLILFWMFISSRMQKSMGNGIFNMGSARKLVNAEKPNVKFDDMAGNEEAKEEVVEIVDFLKHPDRYTLLGAKIPRGVLLVGPPGTGKTLLAKAVAGEANVPFFSMSGSSFIEMFVGMGASRVRDLFAMAKKDAPSIIFIDEIDAIGKSRAAGGIVSGNDEREQTLNQLLAEMDGFGSESAPVIVLAATNRPEILDPALLRPGRFDRQVLVDRPDYKGRIEILKVHIKAIKPARDVDLNEIAKMTVGLAGADLANIINEAALLAGRMNKTEVSQKELKEAVERGIAGLEKKSRRVNKKEKEIVAYHESGHAVIAALTKGADQVNKVSIIPRGMAALGYTLNFPQDENKYLHQKHELMAEVDVLLGGRAAEEVFLEEISTGASNDLERATDILRRMASYYGMTDVSGLMVLEKSRNQFLGGGRGESEYSEQTAEKLDHFIQTTLNERFESVKQTLRDYKEAIQIMTEELLEKEVIDGARVREILKTYEEKYSLPTRLVILEEK